MDNLKTIVKRKLPLDVKYTCIDKKYIPLVDSCGIGCDNCGKAIANIATIKSINGTYSIGFDCLETFLLNNNLLEGFDVAEYDKVKKMIPKILRFSKTIKEVLEENKKYIELYRITGINFEYPKFDFVYYFDWITKGKKESSQVCFKNVDFNFMIETIKNIFPKLEINIIK